MAKNIKLPLHNKYIKRVLTDAEQETLAEATNQNGNGKLYTFLLYTGLRLNEALALLWNDVDFQKETVRVNKARTVIGKPKLCRVIPLSADVNQLLQTIRAEQEKSRRLGDEYQDNGLIFSKTTGEYLEVTTIGRKFRELVRGIGLPITMHGLRHSYIARCLEIFTDMKVEHEFPGYSGIEKISDMYIHALEDNKNEDPVAKGGGSDG